MRSLYQLGSSPNYSDQTQVNLALNFCCSTLGFEKFLVLENYLSHFLISHSSDSDKSNIIKKQFTDKELSLLEEIESYLGTSIKYFNESELQNSMNIEKFLFFYNLSETPPLHNNEHINDLLDLVKPYISYLIDRNQFKATIVQDNLRIQKVIQESTFPMAMFDKEMRFITYNNEWLIQNEISKPNITGLLISDVMPHYPERWNTVHLSCLEGKIEINKDDMYKRADGSKRYLRWSASPWFDITGQINGIILSTDSNEEIARKRDLAINASKMKTEFLAQMSHEIRNPLNGIICLSDLILETNLTENQSELAKMIKCCSDSLLAIVTDILDLSKIESGAMEIENTHFSLKKIIDEANSIYSPLAEKKKIQFKSDSDLSQDNIFLGDPTKIRQILFNLLSKALKFTEAGSVSLLCTQNKINDDETTITCSVADSGIGIQENKLNFIFNPFIQADESTTRKFGGCGLGLFITKKLLSIMGGNIIVTSELNKGSIFTFTLTLKNSKVSASNLNLKDVELSSEVLPDVAILLVDDNQINRRVLMVYLQRLGLKADAASNGFDAISLSGKKAYDLILMDCNMDGMDDL
jgi:signal transduction histidine kinase